MKKWLKIISGIVIVLLLLAYFVGVPMVTKQIVALSLNYEVYTHEMVFESEEMRNVNYDIFDNKNPTDYGFKDWKEVSYTSLYDKEVKLGGWWIPSATADSSRVIMISHGRTANRLKPMKFLTLFKELGLDTTYNYFIPDHRNSGTSSPAQTQLGNKFAEDIAAATFYLQDNYGVTNFTYHSFSMGAMATCIFLDRADLEKQWKEKGITVEQLILDSPLSNIEETMKVAGKNMGFPAFITNKGIEILADSIQTPDGKSYFSEMKVSNLLKDVTCPIIILQNKGDLSTPFPILEKELEKMEGMKNITTVFFEPTEGEPENQLHVQMYSQYKADYTKAIKQFLVK